MYPNSKRLLVLALVMALVAGLAWVAGAGGEVSAQTGKAPWLSLHSPAKFPIDI